MTASATMAVNGSIAIDGKGVVTDYSVTGTSELKLELGPANVHAGAEIGYTPGGGLTSDVTAGAQVSLSEPNGYSGELSFEASARRGSTFTAKAEYNYNPFSDKYDQMINELAEDVSDLSLDTSMKKEIWSGTYSF